MEGTIHTLRGVFLRSISLGVVLSALATSAMAMSKPRPVSPAPPAEDRNWVALHLIDSFYPMTETQTFPEVLSSLEIMNNYFAKRALRLEIDKFFLKQNPYGVRSREGHYMIWIHLSDSFLKRHRVPRSELGDGLFVFPNRDSDIFTGWGGAANIAGLLREGIVGLARPTVENGRLTGNFQGFRELTAQGDADYEAGWYVNDEQAARLIEAIQIYPGRTKGYAFLARNSEKPNPPFDPPNAELVNGYNCGDFAFFALNHSGVIPKEETEALKVRFWYPTRYYDRPAPLAGAGARGGQWLAAHPDATMIPGNVFMEIGWADLLFGWYGIEFFDKARLVSEIWNHELEFRPARIWEQAKTIAWMKQRADFKSKGLVSEIQAAADLGVPITSPHRTIQETPENRYILTDEFATYQRKGNRLHRRKFKRYGLEGGEMLDRFRATFESLKRRL